PAAVDLAPSVGGRLVGRAPLPRHPQRRGARARAAARPGRARPARLLLRLPARHVPRGLAAHAAGLLRRRDRGYDRAMIRAAVIGASGYTGAELIRLLPGHPDVTLASLHARASAGQPIGAVFPQFAGVLDRTIEAVDAGAIAARADVAFSALPHGESAPIVAALVARGVKVLDLSADFRLHDPDAHPTWDGGDHAGELRGRAIYGLPVEHPDALQNASLV